MTYLLVRLRAPNDRNGNPRRGWSVHSLTGTKWGDELGFIDEGYAGYGALNALPGPWCEVASVECTPREYRLRARTPFKVTP